MFYFLQYPSWLPVGNESKDILKDSLWIPSRGKQKRELIASSITVIGDVVCAD